MCIVETPPEIVAVGGSPPSRVQGREAVAEGKVSIRLSDTEPLDKSLHQLEASDARHPSVFNSMKVHQDDISIEHWRKPG